MLAKTSGIPSSQPVAQRYANANANVAALTMSPARNALNTYPAANSDGFIGAILKHMSLPDTLSSTMH